MLPIYVHIKLTDTKIKILNSLDNFSVMGQLDVLKIFTKLNQHRYPR